MVHISLQPSANTSGLGLAAGGAVQSCWLPTGTVTLSRAPPPARLSEPSLAQVSLSATVDQLWKGFPDPAPWEELLCPCSVPWTCAFLAASLASGTPWPTGLAAPQDTEISYSFSRSGPQHPSVVPSAAALESVWGGAVASAWPSRFLVAPPTPFTPQFSASCVFLAWVPGSQWVERHLLPV